MKTKPRGRPLSTHRPTFIRMRLKPKQTKTTFKTLSTRPVLFKTSPSTTGRPEIFRSGETKKILRQFSEVISLETTKAGPSIETISPPSLTPVTVTQSPTLNSTSGQDLGAESRHRVLQDKESKNVSNQSTRTNIPENDEFVPTENPKLISNEQDELRSDDIKFSQGHEILNGAVGKEINTLDLRPDIRYSEDDSALDTTEKNEYDILPAVSIFGSLLDSEQKIAGKEESGTELQPQPLVMEDDIEYFNEDSNDVLGNQIVTDKVYTDDYADIETFKPIVLNDNEDLSTQKTFGMEKDVETFNPEFDGVFLSKDSMPEIQEINATIEPPPAFDSDDADVVHVHETEATATPVPDLNKPKKPVAGASKGKSESILLFLADVFNSISRCMNV